MPLRCFRVQQSRFGLLATGGHIRLEALGCYAGFENHLRPSVNLLSLPNSSLLVPGGYHARKGGVVGIHIHIYVYTEGEMHGSVHPFRH